MSDFFVRCGAELRLDHEWQAWFGKKEKIVCLVFD